MTDTTSSPTKPVPVPHEADRPFWDGLAEGRLVLSRCDRCSRHEQRDRAVCSNCSGESFTWTQVSGRGTIHSYTVVRQSAVHGFADEVPYVLVGVSIEEEPECVVVTNLVGEYDIDRLDLGRAVIAEFEPRGDVTLLQFRLEVPGE